MLRTRSWSSDGSSPARRERGGQRLGGVGGQRAQLDVAPGGQLDPAVAELGGQPRERPQLRGGDEAAGQPHPRQVPVGRLHQAQRARAAVTGAERWGAERLCRGLGCVRGTRGCVSARRPAGWSASAAPARGGVRPWGDVILLLSTSDTDLLSARASGAGYRLGNPARVAAGDLPALLDGATVVVVRLLGGRRAWEEGLDARARLRACPRSCSAASRRPTPS